MSLGPLGGVNAGVLGSAAGSPLSQTKGAASERAAQDSAAQERVTESDKKSEKASGIGQTESDQGSSDRDADGRRLWERTSEGEPPSEEQQDAPTSGEPTSGPPSDGTGERLDLIG